MQLRHLFNEIIFNYIPGIDSASRSNKRKRPEKIDTVKIIFDGDSGGIQKTTIVAADKSKHGNIKIYP
jgi:hypothetical protein